MDLADRVIQANEQEIVEKDSNDSAPDGFYTDDLGFWVEQDIRRHKSRFAEYVLFRCLYLNEEIHIRNSTRLFNGYKEVPCTSIGIASLADLPENIPAPIAVWVYKRVFSLALPINRDIMEINSNWVWDVNNCLILKIDDIKKEKDGKGK